MIWSRVLRPLLFTRSAEAVHEFSMGTYSRLLRLPLIEPVTARRHRPLDPRLAVDCFGLRFPGPVGLAAGFDKNARWVRPLAALGFGSVEVGTVTPKAQPGNERPRLFRLPHDRALINRLGFNNEGMNAAKQRLERVVRDVAACETFELSRTGRGPRGTVIGVNLGKNKITPNENAPDDYRLTFDALVPLADYITVNVSSPNTVGLRDLQDPEQLGTILRTLADRNRDFAERTDSTPRPILLKIAPDLDHAALPAIVEVVREQGLAGIIATNTTIAREPLTTDAETVREIGAGGLSGAPLTERSRAVVAELYRLTDGELPIIGVGGIMNGEDAWQMIGAGASLVQTYTGFIYGGPGFVRAIHNDLSDRLDRSGFASIAEATGWSHRG